MKKHKIVITLLDDDFSMLEEIRGKQGYGGRSKSNEIAFLIFQEWEKRQEEKWEKTPAEIVEGIKAFVSRMDKKTADYVAPCDDTRIIQFPVRQIRQFLGSA